MLRALQATLTVLAVALGLRFFYGPSYLNYDAIYSLLWAADVWNGFTPSYEGFISPTPHPLQTGVSMFALPLGDSSDNAIVALVLISFGWLIWLTYRLGAQIFSSPVGVVAALLIFSRAAFHKNALVAYQDIPFVMFVVWAVLLEAERPRRGWPVLVLLGLAGLLRPEAWALAGLYFIYLLPALGTGARLRAAALAAVGPVVWSLTDFLVTGNPLHSLQGTSDLAAQLDRPRSIDVAPFWTAKFLGFTLREAAMIGVPIGMFFAWRHVRRPAILPLFVAVLLCAIFISSTLVGLPLIARYVLTPAVLLSLFFGLAIFGWKMLEQGHPERRLWQAVAVGVALLWAGFFVGQDRALYRDLNERTGNTYRIQENIRVLAQAPLVDRLAKACGRISTTDHRPVPYLRYWRESEPGSVQSRQDPANPMRDLIMFPASPEIAQRFYDKPPDLTPPPGFKQVYFNESWRLYASHDCLRRMAS